DEEVLRVGVRVREAPGDLRVVTDDDPRDPGEGESDELVRTAFEPDLVPDRGVADREVRVADQDRLPRRGARRGEGPAVRAGRLGSRTREARTPRAARGTC